MAQQIIARRDTKQRVFTFSLQWHVTSKCDQKCKHCYMYDSPFYESECANELSLDDCKKVLDDFANTINRWKVKGSIFFSGGDPLLRDDFFDILRYAQSKGLYQIGVMGNSYHIDKPTALKLRECGVSVYQISLDGMRDMHDFLRKPGSFDDTLRAYEVLKEVGIAPTCMYTVSKLNKDNLIDVIRLVSDIGLGGFDFDRLVPVGSGKHLKDEMLDPEEYRELLMTVEDEYQRLEERGCRTNYGHKDNLWWLLGEYRGINSELAPLPSGCDVHRGCLIGWSGMSILSDGNVMACRRLPILIGKVPDQTIADVFINSPILNELRDIKKLEKCGTCSNLSNCRGCRAIAYGASGGDAFAKDPQCWV